jgi:hypothetical protein
MGQLDAIQRIACANSIAARALLVAGSDDVQFDPVKLFAERRPLSASCTVSP